MGGYFLLPTLLFLVVAAAGDFDDTTDTAIVLGVVKTIDPEPSDAAFLVQLDSGVTVELERDPEVQAGQRVEVRGSSFSPDGLIVGDEFVPAKNFDDSDDAIGFLIVGFFFMIPVALAFAPVVWGFRSVRQIRRDMSSGSTDELTGQYLGSWMWRGLATRIARRSEWLPVVSVPIAIADADGKIRWATVPAHTVEGLVEFETYLREQGTTVTAKVHPSTRVLSSIRSGDGGRHIDFSSDVDVLSPDTGLQLVFSRRSRRRRLPDR